MPNRILRDDLLDSDRIASAGELAVMLWVRLVLVADDFGRFDGRITKICRKCWPAGGDPGEAEVRTRLQALVQAHLVVMYDADGKTFLFIPNFRQRTRADRSKYPPPPADGAQPVDNSVSEHSEDKSNEINALSHDSQSAVIPRAESGQATAVRARSRSSYSYSKADDGHTSDKSTSTPKAASHSLAKAKQVIEENRIASERAADPPGGDVAAFFANATKPPSRPPAHPIDDLDS